MNRRLIATSALAAAVTLAFASQTVPVRAADVEQCYGINAKGKNDCKAAGHDCKGMSAKERDAGSFVLVPAGACAKIAGGSTKAG